MHTFTFGITVFLVPDAFRKGSPILSNKQFPRKILRKMYLYISKE